MSDQLQYGTDYEEYDLVHYNTEFSMIVWGQGYNMRIAGDNTIFSSHPFIISAC